MIIKKFNKEKDYDRIIKFLRDNYNENKSMVSWLPERFDDLIYRIDTLYHGERGQERNIGIEVLQYKCYMVRLTN